MTAPSKRRPRDPDATKKAILEAAVSCLAAGGPEGVTLSDVAEKARVNRSTAYEYFETRENLIKETREWASDKLFRAVFGDPETLGERQVEKVDMLELTERIANFAMENPELCRVWLMQALSLPDPAADPFWREFEGGSARFAKTNHAQKGMDAEVFTVIQLAGALLWPVHSRARAHGEKGLREQVQKYVREHIRFALYGSIRPEYYSDLIDRLNLPAPGKPYRELDKNLQEASKVTRDAGGIARDDTRSADEGSKLTLTFESGWPDRNVTPTENTTRRQTLAVYDEDALKIWRLCGSTLFGADRS